MIPMHKIVDQVDAVIEAARKAQSEQGPDADYRRAAEAELANQRAKLIIMIEKEQR